jgi:hypothetical protein
MGENKYSLTRNNCEHFARWSRNSCSCSCQINLILLLLINFIHSSGFVWYLDGGLWNILTNTAIFSLIILITLLLHFFTTHACRHIAYVLVVWCLYAVLYGYLIQGMSERSQTTHEDNMEIRNVTDFNLY